MNSMNSFSNGDAAYHREQSEIQRLQVALSATVEQRDALLKEVQLARDALNGVNVDSRWFDRAVAILDAAIAAARGVACANPVCDTSMFKRECCGTFFRTPHRSTCQNYRGKKVGAA